MSKKNWTEYKKSELLDLPFRNHEETDKLYDAILIVPARTKHESGFMHVALVGCIGDEPVEITAYPDDVMLPLAPGESESFRGFRMDASYPSGILRLWSNRYSFKVGFPVSSTEIEAVRRSK